jgi:Acyl-coenzyme A:6-aminopenicillanic acid acyl-transferase
MNFSDLLKLHRKKYFYFAVTFYFIVIMAPPSYSCTIFSVEDNGAVYAGNNEDWKNNKTYIWFVPGNDGSYGAVYFGFNNGYPQGGMNEKGLFFDWAALPSRKEADFGPEKPMFGKIITLEIMEKCATVDQALKYFTDYHYSPLKSSHILIADGNGDSAIVELGKNGLEIIRKNKKYQVITNFYTTDPNYKMKDACPRYQKAEDLLDGIDLSEKNIRNILQQTQQYGPFPTQYSYILDLKDKKILLFNSHDFKTPVTFDLNEELKTKKHAYRISSLFEEEKRGSLSDRQKEFIFLNVSQPVTINSYESFLFMSNSYYKLRTISE